MKRLLAPSMLALTLVCLAPCCRADALSEGRALYKAGNYQQAVAKLEQATRENPNDAKAWWQLNFAYNKLGRYSDALAAVRSASAADPRHTFTSEPGKYQEVLQRLESKAGAPARSTARTGRSRAGGGNLTQQLTTGDVYVAPGMKVDAARLEAVSKELRPTVVKFVVFNSLAGSNTLARDAERIRKSLRDYINRGQGYVIVVSRAGIAVSSSAMSRSDLTDMTRQVAPQIAGGDMTGGLVALARGLVKAHPSRVAAQTGAATGALPQPPQSNVGTIVLGVIIFLAIVVIAIVAIGRIGAKRRMAALRGPLERQKGDVVTQLNSLDEAIPSLGPGAAARVREARVTAGTKLDQAARIMVHPRNERELTRAQTLLDEAQTDLEGARALVNSGQAAATPAGAAAKKAGTGAAPPVYAEATQTSESTDWSKVPENERGVCFFCSRPSLLSELTPVTVKLSGQQQKVLACATDLATIKGGQVPQIRAFQQGGKYVPWYAYNDYDPYRDYYGRGYGTGSFLSDMIMLNMVDNMYWGWNRPMGWGWGGGGGWGNSYVFYPDHAGYQDYYSAQAASQPDPNLSAGGTDFLQDIGPGDTSGGADFGTDQS